MDIIDTVKDLASRWKTMGDYEKEANAKKAPKTVVKKTEIVTAPEDDFPATGPDGKYLKPVLKKAGGTVSSASSRADGCCTKGKTKGRIV